jgi:hypothetical protein
VLNRKGKCNQQVQYEVESSANVLRDIMNGGHLYQNIIKSHTLVRNLARFFTVLNDLNKIKNSYEGTQGG